MLCNNELQTIEKLTDKNFLFLFQKYFSPKKLVMLNTLFFQKRRVLI